MSHKCTYITSRDDSGRATQAKDEMDALLLFRSDLSAFVGLYAFLSQVFDYGNTDIEKRHIFYKRLVSLLKFGRERDEIDTSQVTLTHHRISSRGQRTLAMQGFQESPLTPYTALGSGSVQDKQKALFAEIIAKVNDLFQGDIKDDDKLIYVNNVLKGKLLQSDTLSQQATNNTKEQFASSPDLAQAIMDAIIDAFDAHSSMSKQALDSEQVRDGLKDVLLGPAQLYEALKAKAGAI